MRLTVQDILVATGAQIASASGSRPPRSVMVTGISTDSRTLRPGDLFIALRGPRADGHDFIAEAFRNGAAAALTSRPFPGLPAGAVVGVVADPLKALGQIARAYGATLRVRIVGVTGSVGKTTTTGMCTAVLGMRFRTGQTQEEWNAEIGVPLAILSLDAQHDVAVIEMGMRGLGQIADLVAIAQPEIGVVTYIGEAHLEFLGTQARVAEAKAELVRGLPAHGTAILNADDALVLAMKPLARGPVVTYGLIAPAEVTASRIRMDAVGTTFRLAGAGRTVEARLPIWGRHNVSNALAAASVGLVMGLDLELIAAGLARFAPPKMRLQPLALPGDLLILNDAYNASPASMHAAFEVLQAIGRSPRRIALLGEMRELGAQSAAMHHAVGTRSAQSVDLLIVVGDNDAVAIAEGAKAGGLGEGSVYHLPDPAAAVELLTRLLRPGDVLLVKGSRAAQLERVVEALQHAANPRK